MKLYIIAGEASGDLHGSNLVKGLKDVDPSIEIRGIGGQNMKEAGADIWRDYKDTAVMGFTAVVSHLGKIARNMRECRQDILRYSPDAVILIDYPGFNLQIAGFAHKKGFPVFYYIAPKVWAWKEWRVRKIRKFVDRVFVIFPFEVDYFAKHGIRAEFDGNPLMDSVASDKSRFEGRQSFLQRNALSDVPIIALLPGSRKMEISFLMPRFVELERLAAAGGSRLASCQFVLAAAPEIDLDFYKCFLSSESRIRILKGETYGILKNSICAVVDSGTATLEAALIGVPEVAVYGGGALSFALATSLIRLKNYTLPNIIMGRSVIVELMQDACTARSIGAECERLIYDNAYRSAMQRDYDELRGLLGEPGASQRTAQSMIDSINSKNTQR